MTADKESKSGAKSGSRSESTNGAKNGSAQSGVLDPLIHESSRLVIVAVLSEAEWLDFNFLLTASGLTKGNFSTHVARLVTAGYVEEVKEFVERKPRTSYRLTKTGRAAYRRYQTTWRKLTGGRIL
jgi:DNA-binding MarR family transcriptional regulator